MAMFYSKVYIKGHRQCFYKCKVGGDLGSVFCLERGGGLMVITGVLQNAGIPAEGQYLAMVYP